MNKFNLIYWIILSILTTTLFTFTVNGTKEIYGLEKEVIKESIVAGYETKNSVCLIDNFKTGEGNETSHGDKVLRIIKSVHPDIEIKKFHHEEVTFNHNEELLMDCDIINYSMSLQYPSEEDIESYLSFMARYDGFVVAAAGNPEETENGLISDTYDLTIWSYLKKHYKDQDFMSRVLIVSQASDFLDEMSILMSYGEEIDYVVRKGITPKMGYGTSFAAPYVTALLFSKLEYNEDFSYEIAFNENQKDGYYKYITE